jgi:hypothetical protein
MPRRTAIITKNEQCSAEIIIYPYQTQEVRDLAWACFSPPLLHIEQVAGATSNITACNLELTSHRRLWLEQLDRDASVLRHYLSLRPTHRLGVYFEQLWHFFLQQDAETELVAHNLPVHHQGKTLGEFDCIYYCRQRDCHVHLELAVKYFLASPRTNNNPTDGDYSDWLGPDNRDRLDLKLDHLLQRQILLGDNPTAKQKLCDLGVVEPVKEIAFKGYLFQPRTAAPPPPPAFNQDCHMNHWLGPDQIQTHCSELSAEALQVLPKMRWLCRALCDYSQETVSAEQLLSRVASYFEKASYPLLVAALDKQGMEISRFFVTPDNWPEQSR